MSNYEFDAARWCKNMASAQEAGGDRYGMGEKFSPGPWCADVDMYDEDGPLAEPEINGAVMDKEGCTVCHCSTEANVHLVAAAPEMYAALERLYGKLLMSDRDGEVWITDEDGEMALNALKKARGEE